MFETVKNAQNFFVRDRAALILNGVHGTAAPLRGHAAAAAAAAPRQRRGPRCGRAAAVAAAAAAAATNEFRNLLKHEIYSGTPLFFLHGLGFFQTVCTIFRYFLNLEVHH